MKAIDKLIEIYGRCAVDAVGADAEYVTLCIENDADTIFCAQRQRVEEIKLKLEKTAGIQTSYKKQVKYVLRALQQLVGSEDQRYEICIRLARLAYYPKWSEKQAAYFNETSAQLETGLDYFLSFTQRNQSGAGNPINSDHRYLIQSVGLPDPKDNKQNELAHMLDTFLRISKYQFRGFYFPTHEDDSVEVVKKLTDSLGRAQVFIQLVQNDMFSKHYPPEPNYCFQEYMQAHAHNKNMIFIFANGHHPTDLISEIDVVVNFENWAGFVRDVDCLDMEATRIAEQSANVEANRDKLKKRVVEGVEKFRQQLWEAVPGDLD